MGLSTTESAVANLRAEIARRRLSGREFGRRMDWSKNTTVRKLNGQSPLTVADLERAAAVLEVSVLALMQPVSGPVREAGAAYPALVHLCLALAVVALLAAALPGQALAVVAGAALAGVGAGAVWLAAQVVMVVRALDDHP